MENFKDAHTIWKVLEKRNTQIEIFEDIEIHIIEMPKVGKYKEETQNKYMDRVFRKSRKRVD